MVFPVDPKISTVYDDFPSTFFRACWRITEHNFILAVRDTSSGKKLLHKVKDNLILPTPKRPNVNVVDNFKLISLCTFVYKVVEEDPR